MHYLPVIYISPNIRQLARDKAGCCIRADFFADLPAGRQIFVQHISMNSRGKKPRREARMTEDAIFCLILTVTYELCGLDISFIIVLLLRTENPIPGLVAV